MLREPRRRVREALEAVSVHEAASTKALKLGKKNQDERLRNLELDTSGAMPAIERYTGVLYDALDADSLGAEARAWLDAHVFVQSALFGLLRAADEIPSYRVSASSRLPELGGALAKQWAGAHSGALAGRRIRARSTVKGLRRARPAVEPRGSRVRLPRGRREER